MLAMSSPSGIEAEKGAFNAALAIALLSVLLALLGAGALILHPIPFTDEARRHAAAAPAPEPPLLRLVGSNTIGSSLAPALAKAYLEQRLGARGVAIRPGLGRHDQWIEGLPEGASRPRRIEVAATGSSFAFSALERGEADIGLSSRAITPVEIRRLAALGNMRSVKSEHILGLDGIAVIVNPGNPITTLTLEQVARLFDGTVKNWLEIGGVKQPVHRYARNKESGTYLSFLEMVTRSHGRLARNTRYYVDSRELSEAVAADPGAIGFVAIPYVGRAKALKLAALHHAPFAATPLNVYREDYPLSRRLYLYTPETPANPRVADFLDFALSPAGQALVEDAGFVGQREHPISPPDNLHHLPENAPRRYVELTRTADRVSFSIRFKEGEAEPDSKAWRDLPRLIQVLISPQYRKRQVILATFAGPADGTAAARRVPPESIAKLKAELERNGLTNVKVEDFGQSLPLAPTDTSEGREKNRRIELWLVR